VDACRFEKVVQEEGKDQARQEEERNLALCNGDDVVRVAGWLDDSETIVVLMQLTSREREMAVAV